jgi:hypothetical protein
MTDSPLYEIGNPIEIEFVIQQLKPNVAQRWGGGPPKIVIEVRVGSKDA